MVAVYVKKCHASGLYIPKLISHGYIHDLTNVFQTIFGYFFKGTCMIYLNNYHYVANTFRPFLQVNREMLLNVTYKSQKWIKLLLEKKRRKKVSVADKLRFLKKILIGFG